MNSTGKLCGSTTWTASILIAIFVLGGLAQGYAPLSYGAPQMGSIQINVEYVNGDRADTYGQVVKIYQDTNQTAYSTISPTSYPILVNSLEMGHKYKIDVYRYGMHVASRYVDLTSDSEQVDIPIPLDGGIKFNVFYSDGQTPAGGLGLSLKSFDGTEWEKGDTNSKGQSSRFWVQSTSGNDEYYTASFAIDKNLNWTFPVKISVVPGSNNDINVITPWPPSVDSQISVSVFKSPYQKVGISDGNFLVILRDGKGGQVAQSPLVHGIAYFSSMKVGTYSFHVIKIGTNMTGSDIGSQNDVIVGNRTQFDIYLQNQTGNTAVSIGGNMEVSPQTPAQNTPQSCRCVVFRLDDVQDHFVRASDLAVLNLFMLKHHALVLGIVTNHTGDDPAIVKTVDEGIKMGIFYPVLHGYDHVDYTKLNAFQQWQSLNASQKKMQKLFGNTSDILIPPYNYFNNATLGAMAKVGLRVISAGAIEQPIPFVYKDGMEYKSSTIYQMPQQSNFPILRDGETTYFSSISLDEIEGDIQLALKKVGYAVVTLHPQDFAKKGPDGKYVNTNNGLNYTRLQSLTSLMDYLASNNIRMTTFDDVIGIPKRTFPLDNSTQGISGDPSVISVNTLGRGPAGVAVNPETNMVYVSNSQSNSVSVIDGLTGAVLGTIGVGEGPVGISVNPKTNMVYVVNSYEGTVSVINGSTNSVSDTINLGTLAYGVTLDPSSNKIYAIDPYSSSVDFIDGVTGKITNTVQVGGSPQRIAVDTNTNNLYVTNSNSNIVSVIDGLSYSVIKKIQLDGNNAVLAIAVDPNTNNLYVTNSNSSTISVIDGSNYSVIKKIHLDGAGTLLDAHVNPSTSTLYVTDSSGAVWEIDGTTHDIVKQFQLGNGTTPIGISVNDKTNIVYVADANSNTVSMLGSEYGATSAVPEFHVASLLVLLASIIAVIVFSRFGIANLTGFSQRATSARHTG